MVPIFFKRFLWFWRLVFKLMEMNLTAARPVSSRYFPNIQKKLAKNDRHFMAYADFLTIGRSLFLFIKGTNLGAQLSS